MNEKIKNDYPNPEYYWEYSFDLLQKDLQQYYKNESVSGAYKEISTFM